MSLSADLRIDRLEARAAIAELGTKYCIACDDRDYDLLASLFTPDITIRSEDGMMDSRRLDGVMQMFRNMLAIRGPAFHWTHDRLIEFDDNDPDTASSLTLAHAETTPGGTPSIAGIRYRDRYRRTDGVWLFEERRLSFLYYMPMQDFIGRFATPLRMGISGEWREADFPEKLPTWPTNGSAKDAT